jgi:serine/threonine-protein kinase
VSKLVALAVVVSIALLTVSARAQTLEWTIYQDSEVGCRLDYPSTVFTLLPRASDEPQRFAGPDERTSFTIIGADNPSGHTTADIRTGYRRASTGDEITYERTTRDFLVVSGYRGDRIFYTKVSISGDGESACILELVYPRADKLKFDRIVTRMSRSFTHFSRPLPFSACDKVLRTRALYRPETVELCQMLNSL